MSIFYIYIRYGAVNSYIIYSFVEHRNLMKIPTERSYYNFLELAINMILTIIIIG